MEELPANSDRQMTPDRIMSFWMAVEKSLQSAKPGGGQKTKGTRPMSLGFNY